MQLQSNHAIVLGTAQTHVPAKSWTITLWQQAGQKTLCLLLSILCCSLQFKALIPGTRVEKQTLQILVCTSSYHQNDPIKGEAQQIWKDMKTSLSYISNVSHLNLLLAVFRSWHSFLFRAIWPCPHGQSLFVHTEQLYLGCNFLHVALETWCY